MCPLTPPIAMILGCTPWDFLTTPVCWVLVPCLWLQFPQASSFSSSSPTGPLMLLAASSATKISSISSPCPQHVCPGFSLGSQPLSILCLRCHTLPSWCHRHFLKQGGYFEILERVRWERFHRSSSWTVKKKSWHESCCFPSPNTVPLTPFLVSIRWRKAVANETSMAPGSKNLDFFFFFCGRTMIQQFYFWVYTQKNWKQGLK